MILETIYYITQIFGVGAILISLVAIWFQMRQTNAVEKVNAQRHILDQTRQHFAHLSHDRSMFEDVRECMQEYETAAPFKKQRFWGWLWDVFLLMEQSHYQYAEGLVGKGSYEAIADAFCAIIKTPGGYQLWGEIQNLTTKEMVDLVERRLAERGDNIPPYTEIQKSMRWEAPDA